MDAICRKCGKSFKVDAGRVKTGRGKYCSKKCTDVAKSGVPIGEEAIVRFIRNVTVLPGPNSCWLWIPAPMTNGYGSICDKGLPTLAHRFSYEYFREPLGKNLGCHTCDIKTCVNPRHIFSGTYIDNGVDAARKGRNTAILKIEQVIEILTNPTISLGFFSTKFKVSVSAIYMIRSRRNWRHVKID